MLDLMCSSYTTSGVMPGGPVASRHGLAERLAACAAAGYRGYWLHWRDYVEQRGAGMSDGALRALFDRHDLPHRGVEFFSDWFVDGDAAAANAEARSFDAARAIGAESVNVGADFAGRGFPLEHMVERFGALCGRAADRGLRIGLELVAWSDVSDVGTALRFLEPRNAALVIDAWHVFRAGLPLSDLARIPADRVSCIQVNDAPAAVRGALADDTRHRLFCGEGVFDLTGFLKATERFGTPVSVEIISPEVARMPLAEAARISCETAGRLMR
ncbi:MAG: sugar phosphate isomerase/epimerase family protein [Mesorhizobium sp.]